MSTKGRDTKRAKMFIKLAKNQQKTNSGEDQLKLTS